MINQSHQSNPQALTLKIHSLFFDKITFKQIDYLTTQALSFMAPQIPIQSTQKQKQKQTQGLNNMVFVADECLVWTQKGYDVLYGYLLEVVMDKKRGHGEGWAMRNCAANLLLTMNGENQKAYNFKKTALIQMTQRLNTKNQKQSLKQLIQQLDIRKELALNSCIITKNKKSSNCYQYRYKLVQYLIQAHCQLQSQIQPQIQPQIHITSFIDQLHKSEHAVLVQVLARFHRNYFCWMYRLRIFKLFVKSVGDGGLEELFGREIDMVEGLLEKGPNDYSTLSYYRFLLRDAKEKLNNSQFQRINNKIIAHTNQLLEFCKLAYQDPKQYHRFTQFLFDLNINSHQKQQPNKL